MGYVGVMLGAHRSFQGHSSKILHRFTPRCLGLWVEG